MILGYENSKWCHRFIGGMRASVVIGLQGVRDRAAKLGRAWFCLAFMHVSKAA